MIIWIGASCRVGHTKGASRKATRASTHERAFGRIDRDPDILAGEPSIRGTRAPVRAIILTHRFYPDIAELRQAYPMLDVAAIKEAPAFYKANRAEIDR